MLYLENNLLTNAFTADRIVLSLIVLTVLNYLPLGALLVAYDQCGRNRRGLMVGALLVALVCMVTPILLLGSSDGQAAVAVFLLPVLMTPIGVAVYFSVHLGQRLFCGARMRTKDSHGRSP